MTSTLYAIDATAIALFFFSYYRNGYKRGYKVDIWHLTLFQICVLTCQMLAPFADDDSNFFTLGNLWFGARDFVGRAFVISMVGYLGILAGGWLWERMEPPTGRSSRSGFLEALPRQSQLLMSYPRLLTSQAVGCMILQAWILSVYFRKDGFGFDLRLYTFEHPSLRPVAVIISNYSMIIGGHCFARYLATKERSQLISTLLLCAELFFFGSRTDVVMVFFMATICYLVSRREKVSLPKLLGAGVLLILVFTLAEGLREGYYDNTSVGEASALLLFKVFYGNTFSDLRDFALVISGWNGHFWLGRTYLAGLMGFVPRALSSFRDTWSLGAVTTTMVGLNPETHPGLRPGYFGESYLNFGYTGVLLMGLFIGAIVRKVDMQVKRALQGPRPSLMRAFSYTVLLTLMTDIALSAGMATLFVLAGVFGISGACRKLFNPAFSSIEDPSTSGTPRLALGALSEHPIDGAV